MYLQRQFLATDLANTVRTHEIEYQDVQEPNRESNSKGSEMKAAQQPRLRNLEKIKIFILNSFAITTLRENFRQFVF